MESTYRATLLGCSVATAALALMACGAAPEAEQGRPDRSQASSEQGSSVTLRLHALSSSQTDIEARIYADALTGRATEVKPSGTQNGWRWSVLSPRFHVSPSGIRFKGSLVASKLSKAPLQATPAVGKTAPTTLSHLRQQLTLIDRRPPAPTTPPSFASAAFDLPASMTYDGGKLRLAVSSEPVVLRDATSHGSGILASVDLSPYFSSALDIGPQSFVAGSSQLTAELGTVEIVPLSTYIRLRAAVSVQ